MPRMQRRNRGLIMTRSFLYVGFGAMLALNPLLAAQDPLRERVGT